MAKIHHYNRLFCVDGAVQGRGAQVSLNVRRTYHMKLVYNETTGSSSAKRRLRMDREQSLVCAHDYGDEHMINAGATEHGVYVPV